MPVTTQRVNGQLVESQQVDTQALAKLSGQPVPPASPAGVAGIQGNPDQAKMAGTPNQKETVLTKAVNPEDNLATVQRTAAPRQQASTSEETAATKAAQMQQMGSLHSRVETLIKNQLDLQQAAQAKLSEVQTGTVGVDKRTQLEAVLKEVMANPTDKATLAKASQLWIDGGLGTLADFSPDKFIATAQETLGDSAAKQVVDTVQLKGLALDAAEKASLDEAFGKDAWAEWTVPEMSQKLEDLRQQEFNRIQGLQSDLANATGAQRDILLQQLGDAGQVGVTGVEKSVKELQGQVESSDEIQNWR
jgi:hypothetical protein